MIKKPIKVKELNKEMMLSIHYSVTKEGLFRCWGGEDHFGKDCHFKTYKRLESLGRHWQKNHIKPVITKKIIRRIGN